MYIELLDSTNSGGLTTNVLVGTGTTGFPITSVSACSLRLRPSPSLPIPALAANNVCGNCQSAYCPVVSLPPSSACVAHVPQTFLAYPASSLLSSEPPLLDPPNPSPSCPQFCSSAWRDYCA
ncbi:hypothetical protein KC19_VG023000 [Ceratodon purpureus]|uniref:Uncharacterized protein n=1 Tax=Ceratodon purpureus TaxID=3225 RepID=A0A8T0HL88_CERPU|nr:hypothetical protein KC19_VG023000 [Ceratodon purpureus]